MTPDQAEAVDTILARLYEWCEGDDVPITVHCNASNAALPDYQTNSDPALWGRVLAQHPRLHLNLGHFGGARSATAPPDPGTMWPEEIARLVQTYEHLYADSGDHRIDDEDVARDYMAELTAMFGSQATAAMSGRLMYGSDWVMLGINPDWQRFFDNYQTLYAKTFGDAAVGEFLGTRALSFLGFDDPANKNCQRLRARFSKVGARTPTWLA